MVAVFIVLEVTMHKCPHCKEKTISTLKKLMPGWRPRCPECGGKWRLSFFLALYFMSMPFAIMPIIFYMASSGMGLIAPASVAVALSFIGIVLLYLFPLVKKK